MSTQQLTATEKNTSVVSVRSLQQWNHLKDRMKFVQQPIKTNLGWKGWDCDLSLWGVQELTDFMQRIVACLTRIAERRQESLYRPLLEQIASEIEAFLSDFPGASCRQKDNETLLDALTRNVGLVPATNSGYKLIRGVYDQLADAATKNPPPRSPESVVTEKQLEQLLRFFERNRDLRIPIPGFDLKVALRRLRSTSRG